MTLSFLAWVSWDVLKVEFVRANVAFRAVLPSEREPPRYLGHCLRAPVAALSCKHQLLTVSLVKSCQA